MQYMILYCSQFFTGQPPRQKHFIPELKKLRDAELSKHKSVSMGVKLHGNQLKRDYSLSRIKRISFSIEMLE
ncbi:Uncharacterised protein [Fluoribacter dumoffii]|uniref:Uncharacterized protein n=2 Tax=Fluoribacter dumoffii TaxID=463 RepID=A0A377GAN9_9GAMM|nr:hypothetical protein Ldum_2874 [Fluoribacter dumoffii NY 23]STO21896.1 Uncharacterised protein [Fluoribacter dumoffii]